MSDKHGGPHENADGTLIKTGKDSRKCFWHPWLPPSIFQYVFELDFTCPCQQYYDELYCSIYMVVPAVTMFFFVWLIDPERMRICGWCTKNKCLMRRDRKTLVLLGKSVSAASLWIIAALIEGDWYVCLKL